MGDFEFDIDLLISLVEARPVLWDKTDDFYKDRNETKKAWREVCICLREDFEALGDVQKNAFGKEVIKRWGNIRDCYVKSCRKKKEATKSGAGSSKARKYVYSDQLRFLSKLINERQTADSLSVDNMDGSLVTIAEQNRDDMNNFSQETPSRKVRTQQCGKRKRNPDEFELRIMKALDERNQPNRHLSFFKGIIPSLQNFNEEETLHFQMGVLQLIANIKHRKSSNFSSQPLLVYNQPFHTSSHVGGNNPLLVYASTMNPHHLNLTKAQPLAVNTGMVPRTAGQEPAMHNPSLSPPTPNKYGQYSHRQTGASSSTDRDFTVHTPSPSLSATSNQTDCSTDFMCV